MCDNFTIFCQVYEIVMLDKNVIFWDRQKCHFWTRILTLPKTTIFGVPKTSIFVCTILGPRLGRLEGKCANLCTNLGFYRTFMLKTRAIWPVHHFYIPPPPQGSVPGGSEISVIIYCLDTRGGGVAKATKIPPKPRKSGYPKFATFSSKLKCHEFLSRLDDGRFRDLPKVPSSLRSSVTSSAR
jgi:hypothetical protein